MKCSPLEIRSELTSFFRFCFLLIVVEEKNSLSLSLQEWRKARTTAADISQIFLLHFLTKNKLITEHRSNGSFLFFPCLFSAGAYIHYTGHMYRRETIIIHVMWAAHSWTVESIYKHIYTTRHLIRSPDDDEKLHFSKIWFLFLFASSLDLSLMNWTDEYVLALHSITLAAEGLLLFLSHLHYWTHHVCLLMILSLSHPLLGFFFCFAC
jgi:hypothetical protein